MSIKCPNGCDVSPDAYVHICQKHKRRLNKDLPFKCKIKNCHLIEAATK